MHKKQIAILFVLIGLVAVAGVSVVSLMTTGSFTPVVRQSGDALVGGPFALNDQNGNKVTNEDFLGKLMLVSFGYSFCPDICPAELQVMAAALDELGDDATQIQPIFITIDPHRDTQQVLKEYMGYFGPQFIGLTGSKEAIKQAASAYRVYYAKVSEEKNKASANETATDAADTYLMDHSSFMYLMGKDGKFLRHFAYGITPDKLAEGLKTALGH